MKLIFLNRFFYPDQSATSQMLSDLAFALANRGHEIKVITSRLSYEGSGKLPTEETIKGVDVRRLRTTSFGRAALLGRAIDYFTFFLSAGFILARDVRRNDVVIAKTDPPLISALAVLIARLKGARTINWLQDIFPEIAAALGFSQSRIEKRAMAVLRWLRDRSLRRADANVTLGARMAARVAKCGVDVERIAIIANWADGDNISPIASQSNELRRDWGLERAFVVGYSGNLGRAHDFTTFLSAIAIFWSAKKTMRPKFVFRRSLRATVQPPRRRTLARPLKYAGSLLEAAPTCKSLSAL